MPAMIMSVNTGALGRELGRGVRAVVYAFGADEVVKLPNPETPSAWIRDELRLADAAARAGAPVPAGRRLVEVEGRPGMMCARVHGSSMWEVVNHSPEQAAQLGRDLAQLQLHLFDLSPSYELPDQRDRIRSKIFVAAKRHGSDLLAALDVMHDSGGPMVLCHGDLHPSNVMLAQDGPVIVDWFDTCRGDVAAEVARTSLMVDAIEIITASNTMATPDAGAIGRLHDAYLRTVCDALELPSKEVGAWRTVQRVARLAEGFGHDRLAEIRAELSDLLDPR
jgi:Ser/Thr protein kinase RdoA (MazF antagonist)